MDKFSVIFVRRGKTEEYECLQDVPYEVLGFTEDFTSLRKQGICCHRKELDNQPIYDGFLGPMWDGGRLRYETQEVYDILSA